MFKFKKDEWALQFGEDSPKVELVRVAENVHHESEEALVHFGPFATKAQVKYLHKLPASMKRMVPRDRDGKIKTTIPV